MLNLGPWLQSRRERFNGHRHGSLELVQSFIVLGLNRARPSVGRLGGVYGGIGSRHDIAHAEVATFSNPRSHARRQREVYIWKSVGRDLVSSKVVYKDIDTVTGSGRSDSEHSQIGTASLDNRSGSSFGVCLASRQEDIHFPLSHTHVIGQCSREETSLGQSVTPLEPIIDTVKVGLSFLAHLGVIERHWLTVTQFSNKEEQDTFRVVKFERDTMD